MATELPALYLVTQSPKKQFSGDFVTYAAIVTATSKKEAIRVAGMTEKSQYHTAATAELLCFNKIYRF